SGAQPETRHPQTPRAHWYPESLPVFWFDILELRLDHALDSAVFAMEMLQPAGQDHPRLLLAAGAIDARDLLRQRLLDQLLERASLPRGNGFCFAEERLRNFEGRFHKRLSRISMGRVKTVITYRRRLFYPRRCLDT